MELEINKTYTFKIENFQFGDLTSDVLTLMFKDGRICSPFIQMQLQVWFPTLKYVNAAGFDHIAIDGQKFEHKSFTKGGCNFAPSSMVGSGRKVEPTLVMEHIVKENLKYCVVDIVNFPVIRVRFEMGLDMIQKYGKCKIPFKDRETFFGKS
jgi:hypothetical protein